MGNEVDRCRTRRRRSIFLPMLCGLFVKRDTKLNNLQKHPISEEPSSPKVSCMGRVNRNRPHQSSRTLLAPAASSSSASSTDTGSSRRSTTHVGEGRDPSSRRLEFGEKVETGELDPPLPVVKRAMPPGVGRAHQVNIWKRRRNGATLKSLQIRPIHLIVQTSMASTTNLEY